MSTGSDSLSENVAAIHADAHVTALGWLKGTLALGLGDGTVLLARGEEINSVAAHPDAGLLVGVSDGDRFVTGGDDGRVVPTAPASASSSGTRRAARRSWSSGPPRGASPLRRKAIGSLSRITTARRCG